MSVEQLIVGSFNQAFKKYLYNDMVIGQLAHTEFKDGVKKGDEVDVIMPATVTLNDYAGGDLGDAEVATNSAVKIRIDKGKYFHFEIDEVRKAIIANAPDMKQKVELAREYCSDAIKQFAACVDAAYGKLYTRAGICPNKKGTAITLSTSNAKTILAYMQDKFQEGDGKGHTAWIDNKMIAVLPPQYQFYLTQLADFEYVESGHKKMANGFIGRLAGWDIVVSNNIAKDDDGNLYPLFGIKGKTLAGGVSKDLNTKSYMPEKNFNTRYKGYGLFGVGAPRADYLGTVKIAANPSIA